MTKKVLRVLASLAVAAVALVLALALWHHYMDAPWTRDGRVRAEVVNLAPEVAGTVVQVAVADNQPVRKGDVLFVIDPERYRLALAQTQAVLESRGFERRVAEAKAKRRAALSDTVVSSEDKEQFNGTAGVSAAAASEAEAALAVARLNLDRTVVRSPVNGYVTNLRLRVGDYAQAGQASVAVVDSDSFWVAGYFEETKMSGLRAGDRATITLMSGGTLTGHVDSVSRGIADQNAETPGGALADINPVFTWVRLAQRIPVRIALDPVPDGQLLSAGMTCTVSIGGGSSFRRDMAYAARRLKSLL